MPNSIVAAVLLLVALAPGFVYRQAFLRSSLKDTQSSTVEVVELFTLGSLTSFAGLLVTAGLAEVFPWLVSMNDLTATGGDFRVRPWSWILSASLVLLVSAALSGGAGQMSGRRASHRLGGGSREGNGAVRAFTDRSPDGVKPFLAIELTDGRLVEGYLRYVSTNESSALREVVLQHPLAVTDPDSGSRVLGKARLIVIPGSLVGLVHISYPEPAGGTP